MPFPELPPGWTVCYTHTNVPGETHWATRTITIAAGLPAHLERSVLAHEIVHAERGAFPPWDHEREERAVRREAARRLIPLDELTHVAAWTNSIAEAAAELHVDRSTLLARLRGLTPAEHIHLTTALGEP